MRARVSHRLSDERGFTLIECLVAATLLVVGLLGVFATIDGAAGAQSASRSREGAVNLGREFLEGIRGDAYTSVTAPVLTSTLQTMAGYGSMSGSAAQITRRNVPYSVTATVCSIDDPKDGLGTTDATFCAPSTPTSPADNQPDDLKRVTVTVSWSGRGGGSVVQAAMLSSTGAVIGLPTQTFTMDSPTNIGASPTAPIITSSSTTVGTCAAGIACFTANATGARKIVFAVDGTDQSGSAVTMDSTCTALPCPKWHFAWDYSGLTDGVYRITARSVDANNVEGTPKSILVTISKGGMSAPCGIGSTPGNCLAVEGGYNYLPNNGTTPIFELRWQANPERNVVGYKVQTGSGAAGTGTVVCTLDAQGNVLTPSTQTPANAPGIDPYACIDTSPPVPSATPASYGVYAQYSNGSTGAIVDGPVAVVSQAGASGPSTTYTTVTKTFGFDNRSASSGCTKDMTDGWGGSGTSVLAGPDVGGPSTVTFCTPTLGGLFPSATSVEVQGPVDVTTTMSLVASGTKRCTLYWNLSHNGTSLLTNGAGALFAGGGDHQTPIQDLGNPLANAAIPLAERLQLALIMAPPGSNCGNSAVLFGGTTSGAPGNPAPGTMRLDFRVGTATAGTSFARPAAPTGPSKSTSGGTTSITWTGSSGGNVAFYRIYRDGQLYGNRYDTCDVGDTGCDNGNGTFTYTDQSTGGTAHSYWLTAVYGTGTPVTSTLAESAEVAVP